MWNLFTSPDVTVGAAVFPEKLSAYSIDIAANEIIPYVKLNHESGNSSNIGKVDVYFLKSGDTAPAALGNITVRVYVNGAKYIWDFKY